MGFVLLDQFTLAGFAGLIDALRLAADHGGRSRQIHASWTIMSVDGQPRHASCGAAISANAALIDPSNFDYIAVCGGNDYLKSAASSPPLLDYLRRAVAARVRLIGVCTGTFTIARSGLVGNRKVCVNWNVFDIFRATFPSIAASADHLFLDEGDLLTCAGSTAAIDLGLYLIARHCGRDKARQAARHMILQDIRPARLPQPHFCAALNGVSDARIHAAAHFMEQRLDTPPSIEATARYVGVSPRQLERIFHTALRTSPAAFQRRLRLEYGKWLLENGTTSITQVAFDCGFADTAHFSREFKLLFQLRPSDIRKQSGAYTLPPMPSLVPVPPSTPTAPSGVMSKRSIHHIAA
ncbi:HTH-type transcriptional regulator CdhR [Ralstonia syzygii]|uniref:Putative transcriptional regulatory dna-binding transcription regulator protein n=2 Tax=Ralstonia syzygii TaxID=28097 RepID=G2ZYJ8_9RALS|nr:putative transcriptional regulatory dna-binding transcription regulator protein [Ralstonia syzygii R24]